jgi:hypothetical protein
MISALMSFPSRPNPLMNDAAAYKSVLYAQNGQLKKAFYQKAHGNKFIALQTLSSNNNGTKRPRTVLRNWVWGIIAALCTVTFHPYIIRSWFYAPKKRDFREWRHKSIERVLLWVDELLRKFWVY